MKWKYLFALLAIFFTSSVSRATESVDNSKVTAYLRMAFSTQKILKVHERLIKSGFVWDNEICNEGDYYNGTSHTGQLQLIYLKGKRKKGAEFRELIISLETGKNGKIILTDLAMMRGFLSSNLLNESSEPIDLEK